MLSLIVFFNPVTALNCTRTLSIFKIPFQGWSSKEQKDIHHLQQWSCYWVSFFFLLPGGILKNSPESVMYIFFLTVNLKDLQKVSLEKTSWIFLKGRDFIAFVMKEPVQSWGHKNFLDEVSGHTRCFWTTGDHFSYKHLREFTFLLFYLCNNIRSPYIGTAFVVFCRSNFRVASFLSQSGHSSDTRWCDWSTHTRFLTRWAN